MSSSERELLAACKWLISQLESGAIVRDISRYSEPDWPMRMMRFTVDLQTAFRVVRNAEAQTAHETV